MQSGHLGIRFHVAQASLQARLFCYFRTAVEPTYGLQSTMTLQPLPVLISCLGLCAAPQLARCPTLYTCLTTLPFREYDEHRNCVCRYNPSSYENPTSLQSVDFPQALNVQMFIMH